MQNAELYFFKQVLLHKHTHKHQNDLFTKNTYIHWQIKNESTQKKQEQ